MILKIILTILGWEIIKALVSYYWYKHLNK